MPLFGPRKPKFEESARLAEESWKNFSKSFSSSDIERVSELFSTDVGRQAFFSNFYAMFSAVAAEYIAEIRETNDRNQAVFSLHRLADLADVVWLVGLLDGFSNVIFRQREFMLKLLDAVSERNETKIADLKEVLKERTLTSEQKEVVDSILKGFREAQDRMGEKK